MFVIHYANDALMNNYFEMPISGLQMSTETSALVKRHTNTHTITHTSTYKYAYNLAIHRNGCGLTDNYYFLLTTR